MKLSGHILLILAAAVVAKSIVVCPDGVEANCYPQVFQPSNKWQVIREGQQISAGLHVRLNLETGEQEARLLQPEGKDGNENDGAELMLLDHNEESENKAQNDESYNRLRSVKKTRLVESDLSDYDSSVAEVLGFEEGDIIRLNKALDTLIELSHDIDFGVQLATNSRVFYKMSNLAENSKDDIIAEKIYRIMGASLRNNPEATALFLKHHQQRLIPRIFKTLQDPASSELVQRRILGVVHALALDSTYAFSNMNLEKPSSADDLFTLISVFPNLASAGKDRVMLILEDLELVKGTAIDSEGPDKAFSEFLQKYLHSERASSEPEFQTAFRTLAQLHERHVLPLTKAFISWISKEAEERRVGVKERSKIYSKEDAEFDAFVARSRHLIFGNPNAARKQGDEL